MLHECERLVHKKLQLQFLIFSRLHFFLKLDLGPVKKPFLSILSESHHINPILVFLNHFIVRVELLHDRVNLAALVVELSLVVDTLILHEILDVLRLRHISELLEHSLDLLLSLELFIQVHMLNNIQWVKLLQVPVHIVFG